MGLRMAKIRIEMARQRRPAGISSTRKGSALGPMPYVHSDAGCVLGHEMLPRLASAELDHDSCVLLLTWRE